MPEKTEKEELLLFVIWAQALTAMLGSLFYSEIIGYEPCEFCWYQRILMYPLVIIYGWALVKKDFRLAAPGLLLSGIGVLLSAYHYLLQKVPVLSEAGAACGRVPCNVQYVNYFGFITIPFLSLTAFTVIFVLHLILLIKQRSG